MMKVFCGCIALLIGARHATAHNSGSCSSAEPPKTVQKPALLQKANANEEHSRLTHSSAPRLALVSAGRGVDFGSPKCPCIGIDQISGSTIVNLGEDINTTYPADVGAHCEAWDKGMHPSCKATGGAGPAWCKQRWCFVDPCTCDIPVMPKLSLYLEESRYQGKQIYYSYATCGGVDAWTAENKDDACVNQKTEEDCAEFYDTCAWSEADNKCGGKEAMGECDDVDITPDVAGTEGCQCIGFSKKLGKTDLVLNGEKVSYPADVGAKCLAWDAVSHPSCQEDDAPDWCGKKWCYVDPCKCDLVKSAPPKVSAGLADALVQGKPVYYSYATCGDKDTWTSKNHKNACMNQKSKDACASQPKCAWSKDKCLGKELVEACSSVLDDTTETPPADSGAKKKKLDETSGVNAEEQENSAGGPGEPWVPPPNFTDPSGEVKLPKSGSTLVSLSPCLAVLVFLFPM